MKQRTIALIEKFVNWLMRSNYPIIVAIIAVFIMGVVVIISLSEHEKEMLIKFVIFVVALMVPCSIVAFLIYLPEIKEIRKNKAKKNIGKSG